MSNRNTSSSNEENIRYVMVSPDQIAVGSQDEIDLVELWGALWKGKWVVILATGLVTVCSVIYASSLPDIYRSQVLLAPANGEQQGGTNLSGQFGGLASLAGINLGGGSVDKTGLALEVLKSRKFVSNFIEKYQLMPDLMAVEKWVPETNLIVYDSDIYSVQNDAWLTSSQPSANAKPSVQMATLVFTKYLDIKQNEETGMITLGIEHYSPFIAKQWVDWLVEEINSEMKYREKSEAQKSKAYLQSQIEKTTISEHKMLLNELVEEQIKTLMLAEVREEYVFKTIDPALVPESKVKPKRSLIVILGVALGGILSAMFVLIRHFIKR